VRSLLIRTAAAVWRHFLPWDGPLDLSACAIPIRRLSVLRVARAEQTRHKRRLHRNAPLLVDEAIGRTRSREFTDS
jgi:hypothetical protein